MPGAATQRRFDRADSLARLAQEHFDVLVIGGGVTGCGVALDAASRGLSTALVERHDFASGTSSKSSKMVHGGIRYLQQRDFRLVYESLHERQRLLENAPHLVAPLPFLIPLFGHSGVVSKQVARAYATALWLYDLTGGLRIGKRHKRLSKAEALTHLPTLRTDALVAGFLYYDAQADDARLTLTLARTAALRYGAVLANYAAASALLHDSSGKVCGARVAPSLPVPGAPAEPEIEVRASVVVSCGGVWADDLRALDEGRHPNSIRPAKGVHVTVPAATLPADIAAVIPVTGDRRSIFVVPWPDGDDVYIGTTDTDWDGPFDDPPCLPEDVDYLLGAVNKVVTRPLSRAEVGGVWAGLRPLLRPAQGRHVSARTADMSRRHTVRVADTGMVTVTGGKLTTYRLMAEDAVDAAVANLDAALPAGAIRSPTRRLSLLGAAGLEELGAPGTAASLGVDEPTLAALLRRHGDETPQVLALADGRPELLEPLLPGLAQLKVEALWAVREEMALTLDDVVARRTRARLRRAEATAELARPLAQMLSGEWGRAAPALHSEADALAAHIRAELARAGVGHGALSPSAPGPPVADASTRPARPEGTGR